MDDAQKRSPADRILDRYCPGLSLAERKLANERLHNLARTLVRIARRHALDMHRADSTQSGAGGTIPPTPTGA